MDPEPTPAEAPRVVDTSLANVERLWARQLLHEADGRARKVGLVDQQRPGNPGKDYRASQHRKRREDSEAWVPTNGCGDGDLAVTSIHHRGHLATLAGQDRSEAVITIPGHPRILPVLVRK